MQEEQEQQAGPSKRASTTGGPPISGGGGNGGTLLPSSNLGPVSDGYQVGRLSEPLSLTLLSPVSTLSAAAAH
jgi:hypothetical protein